MISGLVVAAAMNPFDVVSTRLYNQNAKAPLYSGPLDSLKKIFIKEGVFGFFKGFSAHYFRMGPHTVLTLTFWEQMKVLTAKYIDD
jgi:solute carrier family 25 protein 34/35